MNYWAWGGEYIGQCSGDTLYSFRGTPIGRFYGEELYNFGGDYIGEIKNRNRIIVDQQKKNYRKMVGHKPCSRIGTSHSDYCGYAMYSGYENFNFKE